MSDPTDLTEESLERFAAQLRAEFERRPYLRQHFSPPVPHSLFRPHLTDEQLAFDVSQFTADTYKGETDV